MMNSATASRAAIAIATFMFLQPCAALAYVQADDSATAEASGSDIIVTARRFDERLQETPVAVTALPASTLTERSVVNVADIGRLAPSLDIKAAGGTQTQSFVFIRGIGQASDNPALEPGVGIYVDDVFLPRSQGGLFDLSDVAQVEVLRGPQGTLYGKNATGGAIRVTSKQPGPNPEYQIVAGYGNYDERRLGVSVNQPLIEDRLFLRVSANIRRRDGYMENLFDGGRTSDVNSSSGRLMLRFEPSADLDMTLSLDTYHDRANEAGGRLLATQSGTLADLIQAQHGSLDPYIYKASVGGNRGAGSDVRFDRDIRFSPGLDSNGASLVVNWRGDDIALKSVTAVRSLDAVRIYDVDATPIRLLNIGDRTEQNQFSQEFQLSGTIGAGALDYMAGLYYYRENIDHDFRQVLTFIPPSGVDSRRINNIGTRSYAAYANLTWHATDALSLTAGARYTREKRSLASLVTSIDGTANLFGPAGASKSFENFSPKIELDYKFTPDIFAYISASRGFKSGGFNSQASSVAELQPFNPETVWSYEAGLKTQWFDRQLTFNVAAFRSDYVGLQQNVFVQVDNQLLPIVSNAADARINGVEVEANWNFGPVKLFGSYAHVDGKYENFLDAVLGDLSDREIPFLFKNSFTIGGQVEARVAPNAEARLVVDYAWKSSSFIEVTNNPVLVQRSNGLLGARATLAFDNGLEVAAYGRNLTNERFLLIGSEALNSLGLAWGFLNEPRTYGIEAIFRF